MADSFCTVAACAFDDGQTSEGTGGTESDDASMLLPKQHIRLLTLFFRAVEDSQGRFDVNVCVQIDDWFPLRR